MANWQGMILTDKGRVLQTKVEAGITKLDLTKIKLGDGVITGEQTLEGLTDLVSPKQIIGITTIDPSATGICKITGTVTNIGLDIGYNIKELGIYATDPDEGEILYSITTDSNFDYLQATGGATIVSEEFNLSIVISNTGNVTATIDATGLLTVASGTVLFNQLIETHNKDANAHKGIFVPILGAVMKGILYLVDPADDSDDNQGATTGWTRRVFRTLLEAALNASGVQYNIAQNGYIKLGSLFGDLILQWGSSGTPNNYVASVIFPIVFASTDYIPLAIGAVSSTDSTVTHTVNYIFNNSKTTTGCIFRTSSPSAPGIYYISIGK